MADRELPTAEKRERILQALDQAKDKESAGYKPHHEGKRVTGKGNTDKTKWTLDESNQEPKTVRQIFSDCIHADESVLENKLIYFLFSVGAAGVSPYLSTYALQLGLPLWHVGLILGAGLLAGSLITPLVGFFADKYRLHRGVFVAVVCMWMVFTLTAVFCPKPARVTCDAVPVQLLEVLSDECNNPIHGSHVRAYSEQIARFPTSLQTSPQPCTIDIEQVCLVVKTSSKTSNPQTLLNVTSKSISETGTPPPTPPQDPEVNTQQLLASNLSKVSKKQSLRDTHLGWLYNQTVLQRTSIAVFVLAAAGSVSQMSVLSMTDAATLVSLGEAKRDRYGWQRSFGTLGYAISSLLVGFSLREMRKVEFYCGLEWVQTDYVVGAMVFAAFLTISVAVSGYVRFKHSDMSSKHSLSTVNEAIFTVNYGSVFVTAFVLSLCNGALNTLLMWHLHIIGATVTLISAGIAMHALADVMTSFCTVWIIKMAGYHIPLAMGIIGYCLTFFCYAIMSKPGWLVVVEFIHGASFAITLNTMTSFLSSSVALVSLATMQGFLSGVYWGLGPAVGTAFFGYLVGVIGLTLSFYALSLVCLMYFLIFIIWNRNDLPFIGKYIPGHYKAVPSSSVD